MQQSVKAAWEGSRPPHTTVIRPVAENTCSALQSPDVRTKKKSLYLNSIFGFSFGRNDEFLMKKKQWRFYASSDLQCDYSKTHCTVQCSCVEAHMSEQKSKVAYWFSRLLDQQPCAPPPDEQSRATDGRNTSTVSYNQPQPPGFVRWKIQNQTCWCCSDTIRGQKRDSQRGKRRNIAITAGFRCLPADDKNSGQHSKHDTLHQQRKHDVFHQATAASVSLQQVCSSRHPSYLLACGLAGAIIAASSSSLL